MFTCMSKMNCIPKFFFMWYLQACYLKYFENSWSFPSIMIVSPCRKPWCSKCSNQLVGNFNVYLHIKSQFHSSLLFWWTVKTLQTCYFGNCENHPPSKIIPSIGRKLSCLPACKKSTSSSLNSFLRHCKKIANLLFWVIWVCLATHT